MRFMRIGLALTMLAVAAPAFADSKVNVKLWDKNGDMNADAKMGMGMPANMSMAMMKIQVDKQVVPAGKVTFEVTNTSKAAVHEMIVVPVTDPKKTTLPYISKENRVDEDAAGHLGEVSELDPGKSGSLTLDLKPGFYAVFCNIPDHFMNGMWATIKVQ
ncbi:plastocyanin/azurin family copper-binding protein [Mesorhizobium sp.]|uniref:plastocyanin/azurin family copper-binding protein n=1 Tax=Mesorhizobium sp. TaxID=1871066 RepID=UPI0025B7B382|nr:plastocyanin/azurin family copper-binding protein [Mesorhizobium sp.]